MNYMKSILRCTYDNAETLVDYLVSCNESSPISYILALVYRLLQQTDDVRSSIISNVNSFLSTMAAKILLIQWGLKPIDSTRATPKLS